MSDSKSPLARLVLFMVCLSVAGAFIAGVYYAAIDLPQQQFQTAPTNAYDKDKMDACFKECDEKYSRNAVVRRMCYISCEVTYGS